MAQSRLPRTPSRVPEAEVRAVAKPEFTDSWHPFSHSEVLDATEQACNNLGWKIGEREYSIVNYQSMIGLWEITNGEIATCDEFQNRLLIRNSVSKSYSYAIGLVEMILACSNLAISSAQETWVTFRRHTGKLTIDEIVFYAESALKIIAPRFQQFQNWLNGLKQNELTYKQASTLAVFAMNRGYTPPAKFKDFWANYDGAGSKYKDYQGTMYAWYNAQTEIMRENNIFVQWEKQEKLMYFLKYEAPKVLDAEKVDEKQIIDLSFGEYKVDKDDAKQEMIGVTDKVRQEWKEKTAPPKVKKTKAKPKKSKPNGDTPTKKKKSVKQAVSRPKATTKKKPVAEKKPEKKLTVVSESKPTRKKKMAVKKCSSCGITMTPKKRKGDWTCSECGELV